MRTDEQIEIHLRGLETQFRSMYTFLLNRHNIPTEEYLDVMKNDFTARIGIIRRLAREGCNG